MITRGQSTTIFLCIEPFSAWWQPNEQTNNRVILVQACSWSVRRRCFAILSMIKRPCLCEGWLFLLKILPILSSWPPSLTKSSLWWITWGTTPACPSSTQSLLFRLGFSARPGEFLPTNWMSDLLTKAACGNLTPLRPVCKNAVFLFVGYDEYFL